MSNIPITVNLNDNWIPSHLTTNDPKLSGMYGEVPMSLPLSMSSPWVTENQYASSEPKFTEMNTVNTQVLGDILLQAAQYSYIYPDSNAHQAPMLNTSEAKYKKELEESYERVSHLDKTIKTLRQEVRRQSRQILSYKQLFNSIATERQLFRAFKGRSVVHLNTRFMGRTLALIPNQRPLSNSGSKSGNNLMTSRRSGLQTVKTASRVSQLINENLNTMLVMLDQNDFENLVNNPPITNIKESSGMSDSAGIKGKSPLTCVICDKVFSRKGHLKRHLKTHEKNGTTTCTSSFSMNLDLSDQPNVKDEADAKIYQCTTCWINFSRAVDLQRHELSHLPETPHKCEICQRFFKSPFHLKCHLKTHLTADPNKSLNDSKCKEKPYKCKFCPETFTYISQRDMHQKAHTGEDPLKCSYCTKTFSIHCNLRAHERVHTGEKPFQCRYCPKAFVQVSHRNCHERTHTGERPYQCSLCSRAFAVLGNLKSHQQTHNVARPRPYNCNVCSKSFFTPRSLKTHIKTHQYY